MKVATILRAKPRPCFFKSLYLAAFIQLVSGLTAVEAVETTSPIVPGRVLIRLTRAPNETDLNAFVTQSLNLPQGVELMATPAQSFQVLQLNDQLEVEEAIDQLKDHPSVAYAEPDYIGTGGAVEINDPEYPLQWMHTAIQTSAVWERTLGSRFIRVAVLDTGIHLEAEEFAGRLAPGYDFVNDDADPSDDHGHGTAVAAILGASANNGAFGVGVDPTCAIIPVKVLDENNNGSYSNWALGIDYAVAQGADVINLSAGGFSSSQTIAEAIQRAVASGVAFVTITHNDGEDRIRFPGSLPESITVGATNRDHAVISMSNRGPEIDLVAPGQSILSINHLDRWSGWTGTSMAAPQVAGVCSLLLSLRPELSPEDLRALLRFGAEDLVGDENDLPGFDSAYGHGRLNALNSLRLVETRLDVNVHTLPGHLLLSWRVPNTARTKAPFIVEKSHDGRAWSPAMSGRPVQYTTTRATWFERLPTESAVPIAALYRLRLRTPN